MFPATTPAVFIVVASRYVPFGADSFMIVPSALRTKPRKWLLWMYQPATCPLALIPNGLVPTPSDDTENSTHVCASAEAASTRTTATHFIILIFMVRPSSKIVFKA